MEEKPSSAVALFKTPSGFAVLPIIFAVIICGLFLSAGLSLIAYQAKQTKYKTSRTDIDRSIASVISWSAQTGRVPNASEFNTITGGANDPWKQPYVYIYDNSLSLISSGGICGKQSTGISASGYSDIAFMILSGGEDYTIQSSPNTSGSFFGTATLSSQDITDAVTLNELKTRICSTSDAINRLDMVNNELPDSCSADSYTATLFAQGGVPPYTWSYASKPDWLTLSSNGTQYVCQGTTPAAEDAFVVDIRLTDTEGSTIERQFVISVFECDTSGPVKKPKKPKKSKKSKKK